MDKLFIVATTIIYIALIIILIVNMKKKNNIIKYSFVAFFLLVLIMVNIYEISILDNLIYFCLRYIYYPTFNAYLLTILLTFIVFIYTIFNDRLSDKVRIINYIFSCLLILSYVMFLVFKIDTSSYKILYTGKSLICLRYATRAFSLWLITLGVFKYYKFFTSKR